MTQRPYKQSCAFSKWMLAILFTCSAACVNAQIVNVESSRMQSDTTGWKGHLGASFSATKNVEKIFQLDLSAHLQYKTEKDLYLILGNYNFLKGANRKLIDNSFFHLRYNRKLNAVVRWEVFTQQQSNVITRIESRFLAGTGPRFKIMSNKVLRLYAGALVMYEAEKERADSLVLHHDFRNSSYVSLSWTPTKQLELVSTSFYQPRLDKFGDYRLLNQETVKVRVTNKLAVTLNWNYLYDSFPAGNTPNSNYSFSTGANYEF